jgi:putative endonuclease
MSSTRAPKPVAQWTDPRHRRGYAGERQALSYLLRSGWRIEAHRFRMGRHDLDLIARRGNLVAFVEVKTRGSRRFGPAAGAVGWRKQVILNRLAEAWRLRFGTPGDTYRFDVITVEAGPGKPSITHLADTWRLGR